MNKVHLSILGVVIILGIIGLIALLIRDNGPDVETEIAKASAEFKAAKPGSEKFIKGRHHVANKLIPHLIIGMTTHEVETLLGKPDKITSDGSCWNYGLWYSQFISIRFDTNGKLIKMNACASAESDERDNPTGVYRLDPNSD
jgi:hypothetical protein